MVERGVHLTTGAAALAAAVLAVGAASVQAQGGDGQAGPVRRLTIEDAVAMALEQNLDLQVERINPQVQDASIALARTGWTPTVQTGLQNQTQNSPADNLFAGSATRVTDDRLNSSVGLSQLTRWGGSYSLTWNSGRSETNNQFASFNPRLSSTFGLTYTQPLLRNFSIDATRQQVLVSRKNREISDVQLQQAVAITTRNVKNAYWDLVFAISSLEVQRQSLRLAEQSLRDNRARVEVGTMAPIDIVQAEAEVAQREEAVILAEAAIQRAEDRLRALIASPSEPGFWTMRLEPADTAVFTPVVVDIEAAVRAALDRRTDLVQARKRLEANDVSIRYFRNQTLPDLNAQLTYSAVGLGGTQLQFGPGFPPAVIGQNQRSFRAALGDAFGNAFPTWTLSVQVSYPLGASNAEANLARARLQQQQALKQLESQELAVATQLRDLARAVQTNAKRVEATRASRTLAVRRLEAEEKKFQAGMSTSFLVFQAQRDLNVARNQELQALIDYLKSVVDYETAQIVPLGGGGAGLALAGGGLQAAAAGSQ